MPRWFRSVKDVLDLLILPCNALTMLLAVAAAVASIVTYAWYWKALILIFVLVFAHLVWGFFLYRRVPKTRKMRKIFADAATRLGNTAASEYMMAQCDALIYMSLKSRLAADYEDHSRVEEWRSKQREKQFNARATRARYFETLSKTLTFSAIDPSFYVPENLDTFFASGIGRIRA